MTEQRQFQDKPKRWFNGFFSKATGIDEYSFRGDIKQHIIDSYGYRGDLLDIFVEGSDQLVHKWHHYIPIYDRYFSSWRQKKVRFLELGVSKGGSISMWRRYFGADAIIYGIDIDPNCAQYDGIDGKVRIGSQDNPEFLRQVVREMGGVDIVLDDGSHVMSHIRTSLETLLPELENDGLYMIEDLHTSYWSGFGGGFWSKANFFNFVRDLIDDMHTWYHPAGNKYGETSKFVTGIHIHDSVVVIDKATVHAPAHSQVQRGEV